MTRTVRGTHNVTIMGLKDYRKANSLSAAEMGRLLGVTHSTILRWEDGKMSPSAHFIRKINEVTRGAVTANDLFREAA